MDDWMPYAIIVIIILVFIMLMPKEDYLLKGFWVMDEDFAKEAGLSNFILFIDENIKNGYIIISNEECIANQPINVGFSRTFSGVYDFSHDMESDFLPKNLKAKFDPVVMELILYEDDNIYAFLRKDTTSTKQIHSDPLVL